MSEVCEVANRVQLMSSGSECSNWLSLAYFPLHIFLFIFLPLLWLFPLLSPPTSVASLFLWESTLWRSASEWALWRQSITYQLLPNADTLTSLTANYYFFMTQPGAITATSLCYILLLLQLSKGVPGGTLEELRHQSFSPSQISAETDWQTGARVGVWGCK